MRPLESVPAGLGPGRRGVAAPRDPTKPVDTHAAPAHRRAPTSRDATRPPGADAAPPVLGDPPPLDASTPQADVAAPAVGASRACLGQHGAAKLHALALAMLAVTAHAGGRARYGGTLPVAIVTKSVEARPLLADTPPDAVALFATRSPLCQLVELSSPAAGLVRLSPRPGVSADDVVEALARVGSASSPYRALLSGVTSWKKSPQGVELSLNGPTADLPRALCHPAFAALPGPFRGASPLQAVPEHPAGRPFLDAVTLATADARGAERLLAQRKAHLVVGATTTDDAPQLFVTVLVFPPALAPHLPLALESAVDRGDLVRFFLRPPSAPMPGLLPASLGGALEPAARPARPAPLSPAREVTVAFDASSDAEPAIAERLQVKLQPLGYRVALKGAARDVIRARAATATELTLQSLLLPASPTAALAVLLDAAGQRARLPQVLASIASASDADARARELAVELLPQLPLVPLATRGVGLSAVKDLQHVTRDPLGLPRLDELFYAAE